MPDPIGYSFAPGSDSGILSSSINRRPNQQEALQILSLVLPKVVGPNAPIPQPLLTAPGAAGGADPGLALLARILGAVGQPGGPQGAGSSVVGQPGGPQGAGSGQGTSPLQGQSGSPGAANPFQQPNVPAVASSSLSAVGQPAGSTAPRITPAAIQPPQAPSAAPPPITPPSPWQVPQMPREIFQSRRGALQQDPF